MRAWKQIVIKVYQLIWIYHCVIFRALILPSLYIENCAKFLINDVEINPLDIYICNHIFTFVHFLDNDNNK